MSKMVHRIKGYPDYCVTDKGEVYSLKTAKMLKPTKRGRYLSVGLYNDGEEELFTIHRLVAEAFLPNEKGLPCVNHKDENKMNNCVDNLEWCTYKYNNHYGKNKPVNNLKNGSVKNRKGVCMFSKDGRLIAEYCSAREAARQTDLNQSNITKCCKGKHKTAGGYIWVYQKDIGKMKNLLGLD